MIPNGAPGCAAKASLPNKSSRCSTSPSARRVSPTGTRIFPRRRFVVWKAHSFRYSPNVQTLVEDFLQFLRHERGQSDNTARTYAALLGKFTAWAAKEKLTDWQQVQLKHLMAFLQHE